MKWYEKRWAPLAAFLLIAVIGGYALYASTQHTADTVYKNQIAQCERDNTLRNESNQRITSHETDTSVLSDFLIAAREARRASGKPFDLQAADEYTRLIKRLDKVKFNPVTIVNCTEVIPKP